MLNNRFHTISFKDWNQTLRTQILFSKSWAAKRIITTERGSYEDVLTDTIISWEKGETIMIKELVTLKLYIDFDELQFELKKCLRWEEVDDKDDVTTRLCEFHHLRISLQTILKKYSIVISA